MTNVLEAFIEEARAVDFASVAQRFGRIPKRGAEWMGACPRCGGKDRYAVNPSKGVFNCRGCGAGGKDAIALAAHESGFDMKGRGFLLACADVLGRPLPDGEDETPEEKAEREDRIVAARAKTERDKANRERQADDRRMKAVNKARGIYQNAKSDDGTVLAYLKARTGFSVPAEVFENVLLDPAHSYWHGVDDRGHSQCIHTGPAMIAPFVDLDGKVTGCHETWLDLKNGGGKYRVALMDAAGEPLVTKKMQGTKKGSVIPLLGEMRAARWVGGEGIENVLAFAALEGFVHGTFYFAAGDLGNLAGKADAKSGFSHPWLTTTDKRGRVKPVRVQGDVPAADDDRLLRMPAHVRELGLVADGDSELIATAAAMARAEARLAADNLSITTYWPPEGTDWAEVALGVAKQLEAA